MFVQNLTDWVDIQKFDARILIDCRYATSCNFTKEPLYSVASCFLRLSVAKRLKRVQDELVKTGLGLMVFDAYRPLSVQRKLWEFLPDERFIADPAKGSCHNRGAAVDLTLVDHQGQALPMPTDFDDFSEKAHLTCQTLPPQLQKNRQRLFEAMSEQGFQAYELEWWHYTDPDWEHFEIMDLDLQTLSDHCK